MTRWYEHGFNHAYEFSSCDVSGLDFSGSKFGYTTFYKANLTGANLTGGIYTGTNFQHCNLTNANLSNSDIRYAQFYGANLSGLNLSGTNLDTFEHCPKTGEFFGYKKVSNGVVLQLLIPESAKRISSLDAYKTCRASKTIVLGAVEETPTKETKFTAHNFVYEIGKTIEEPEFDEDIRFSKGKGIVFSVSKRYVLWNEILSAG
jgi:hypothetical protein